MIWWSEDILLSEADWATILPKKSQNLLVSGHESDSEDIPPITFYPSRCKGKVTIYARPTNTIDYLEDEDSSDTTDN